jgi:hypothetical protein
MTTIDTRTDANALRRLDLQITGLVYARAIRERSGASKHELDGYSMEIARQRRHRAELESRFAA